MVEVALACTKCGYRGNVDYRDPPFNKLAEDFPCPKCGNFPCTNPTNL